MDTPTHPSFGLLPFAKQLGWTAIFRDTDARHERFDCPALPLTFQRGNTFLWHGNAAGKAQVWQAFELVGGARVNVRLYHDLASALTKEGSPVLDGPAHLDNDTQEGAGS